MMNVTVDESDVSQEGAGPISSITGYHGNSIVHDMIIILLLQLIPPRVSHTDEQVMCIVCFVQPANPNIQI